MGKLNLTQYEKNSLFYALQHEISRTLKEVSLAIYDRIEDTCRYELDDARDKLDLYYKLEKEGWDSLDGK